MRSNSLQPARTAVGSKGCHRGRSQKAQLRQDETQTTLPMITPGDIMQVRPTTISRPDVPQDKTSGKELRDSARRIQPVPPPGQKLSPSLGKRCSSPENLDLPRFHRRRNHPSSPGACDGRERLAAVAPSDASCVSGKKGQHSTEDCWGQGTLSVNPRVPLTPSAQLGHSRHATTTTSKTVIPQASVLSDDKRVYNLDRGRAASGLTTTHKRGA
jgi:hypothetical protein